VAAPRKYPDELRERAIRLAVDARRGATGTAMASCALREAPLLDGPVSDAMTGRTVVAGQAGDGASDPAPLPTVLDAARRATVQPM
jgi:hypothetical protein